MKRFLLLAGLLIVFASGIGQSQQNRELDRLAHVDRFAFGDVGYAGVISQGEKDFEAILHRPSAALEFETLYKIGTRQAKAYALVGLRRLRSARFRELAASSGNSKEIVETMSGCIVFHEPFSDVVKRIKSGVYDDD
jgi:hypothetical protein